jgi:epoxyqueuosine reductase
LYGCDTCQIVCPKNKGKNWTHHESLQPDAEQAKPLLKPLLALSNREFKERFGNTAAAWRGKTPIQRNAVIALGHFRDESALPQLRRIALEDERPALRESAIWALSRIGGEQAREIAVECLAKESEPLVVAAIERALHVMEGTSDALHND